MPKTTSLSKKILSQPHFRCTLEYPKVPGADLGKIRYDPLGLRTTDFDFGDNDLLMENK